MTGRFKRKLERINRGFGANGSLDSCRGPGILFCCAASDKKNGRTLEDWIEKGCDIDDYNEEVECDVRGSVALVADHATIACGEIKSSIRAFPDAVKQIELRVNLIAFVLHIVFKSGRFEHVIRKGIFLFSMARKMISGTSLRRPRTEYRFSFTVVSSGWGAFVGSWELPVGEQVAHGSNVRDI
jgi:hypothetical protein